MLRSRKNIVMMMSLCLLVSACEKAKMRTVPRKNPGPAVGVQGAPTSAPQDDGPEDLEPVKQGPPAPGPEVTTAAPAPADPVVRVEEGEDLRRVSAPTRAPRREVTITEGEELHRPRPKLPKPRPMPSEKVVIAEEKCCEKVAPVVEERPLPPPPPVRSRPVVRVKKIEKRQLVVMDPREELHCRWEPTGLPMTYMRYSPALKIAWVQHSWPQVSDEWRRVKIVAGISPFGVEGLTLVTKGGRPIAHLRYTGTASLSYERNVTTPNSSPYEALFGVVPGAPQGQEVSGVCWTRSEPTTSGERGNSGPSGG